MDILREDFVKVKGQSMANTQKVQSGSQFFY